MKLAIDEINLLLTRVANRLPRRESLHYDHLFNAKHCDGIKRFNKNVHLAILIEPYLSLILKGEKTIESRFTKNRIAPYCQAKEGDIILLKKSGGGIVGVAEIDKAEFHTLESEPNAAISKFMGWDGRSNISEIRANFNDQIRATPEFWESKQNARYASLLYLKNVAPLSEPTPFPRQHGSAWLILS